MSLPDLTVNILRKEGGEKSPAMNVKDKMSCERAPAYALWDTKDQLCESAALESPFPTAQQALRLHEHQRCCPTSSCSTE